MIMCACVSTMHVGENILGSGVAAVHTAGNQHRLIGFAATCHQNECATQYHCWVFSCGVVGVAPVMPCQAELLWSSQDWSVLFSVVS
jgi:hypothetical protein